MGSEGFQDRYINPYTDFGFKKLFGTELNKDLLISFLNALLHKQERIKDVTYLNTEHLGSAEYDRRAVFDVYCENERGEKFLVEMQRGEQQFFKDRSVFYSTFPIREQAVRGREWNYELKRVYTVGILNFCIDNTDGPYIREIQLMDTKSKEVFYDKLKMIFIEMPKFHKEEQQLETLLDKWLFVLRNLGRLMARPAALQERVFTRLFDAAEIARFSRQEVVEYEDSLKVYRDWYSVMQTQLDKGVAIGRQKGMAEGMEKGMAAGREKGLAEGMEKGSDNAKKAIARRLLQSGMDAATVSGMTGLPEKDVIRLSL